MEPRLSIVTLGVRDLKRAETFYVGGLGWPKAPSSTESILFLRLNGIALALYPHDALAEDACVAADRSSFRGFSLAYCTRSKEEVDRVLDQAQRAGAVIVKPAQEVFWGGYSGYFADPDGFLWEAAYNPFVSIAPDGALIFPEDATDSTG
ncbi:MAG: VOC family protein [Alphaproteobacteria bacterium]|nr:VOC family protein [Alphaproteobacteria bacterium]